MATAASISRFLRLLPSNCNRPFTRTTNTPLSNPTPIFSNHSYSSIPPSRLRRRLQPNTNSPKTFTYSDSEDEQQQQQNQTPKPKPKLPPPYNPFDKTPIIQDPEDPKDLQRIFHKMRTEGLQDNAIKMFDALSKDGLTHEALELFKIIQDKGSMPDVVAHTAVIEAYSNAGGHSKEALKAFLRMLSLGINPNAYTYTVLIKGLVNDGKLKDAKKYMLEMMDRGIKPNAKTYTSVFEALVSEQKVDEARELLEEMKEKGFKPDEDAVRDNLTKGGQVFRSVIHLLFQ